jgi:hypothetical protein
MKLHQLHPDPSGKYLVGRSREFGLVVLYANYPESDFMPVFVCASCSIEWKLSSEIDDGILALETGRLSTDVINRAVKKVPGNPGSPNQIAEELLRQRLRLREEEEALQRREAEIRRQREEAARQEAEIRRQREEAARREESIRQIVNRRNITKIVHFTHVDNLASIFERGILPRKDLCDNNIQFVQNDVQRLDKRTYATSVSISFPNYKMFHKYKYGNEQHYAVLEVDSSVLWENHCLFCHTNAASNPIRTQCDKQLASPESLEGMFEGGRRNVCLQSCDPTDPQAEVLVMGIIQSDKIMQCNVSRNAFNNLCHLDNRVQWDDHYFEPRCDWSDWQNQN